MRKKLLVLALGLAAMMATAGCTRIGPGHAGIIVNSSGTDRGVLNQTVSTGRIFYNPFTQSVIEYQTSMRNVKWTVSQDEGKAVNQEITFTNADQMVIATDIGLSFSLDQNKVPQFYVKFLAKDEDDLDTKFTDGYLRNAVRNCMNDFAGHYSIKELMGDNAQFLKESRDCIQKDVASYGVQIDQFGLLGAPRPPSQVINSINAKAQVEQETLKTQLQVQQVQAEAQKTVAEAEGRAKAILAMANAQAEANHKLAESLTDNLIRMKAIEKWNGQRPSVEGVGSGMILSVK